MTLSSLLAQSGTCSKMLIIHDSAKCEWCKMLKKYWMSMSTNGLIYPHLWAVFIPFRKVKHWQKCLDVKSVLCLVQPDLFHSVFNRHYSLQLLNLEKIQIYQIWVYFQPQEEIRIRQHVQSHHHHIWEHISSVLSFPGVKTSELKCPFKQGFLTYLSAGYKSCHHVQ